MKESKDEKKKERKKERKRHFLKKNRHLPRWKEKINVKNIKWKWKWTPEARNNNSNNKRFCLVSLFKCLFLYKNSGEQFIQQVNRISVWKWNNV